MKRRDIKGLAEAANFGDTVCNSFQIDFCDGINIIIGENGVGKTSILRMLYAACKWSNEKSDHRKTKRLHYYFGMSKPDDFMRRNYESGGEYAFYRVKTDRSCFEWSLSHRGVFDVDERLRQGIQSVFIPTTEMLSHTRGFLAMNEKFDMPFDGTQVDIIVNAELPPTREISDLSLRLLEKNSAMASRFSLLRIVTI